MRVTHAMIARTAARVGLCLSLALALGIPSFAKAPAVEEAKTGEEHWKNLISIEELQQSLDNPALVIVDARAAEEYSRGHIPGAINLPGAAWRTPASKPGSGVLGQQVFRQSDGALDVARYEKLLGDAGIVPGNDVVVYGNHAGKADGSVPAAILLKLGHHRAAFLDGVGLEEWRQAGLPASQEAKTLPPQKYAASPRPELLWSRRDVLQHLDDKNVIIVDSRTPAEYDGKDLRGNQRGGHIPGAILLNSEELLDPTTHRTISTEAARKKFERVLPRDKTIVIYCQSGTRCSHKELLLRDLGYENVVLYDGSWQEWGNRADTPVEAEAKESPQE